MVLYMLSEKHLFMHYIMSFPVTYEKENREKMRHSFEAGLKKSLPTALLSNPDAMKHFLVEEGQIKLVSEDVERTVPCLDAVDDAVQNKQDDDTDQDAVASADSISIIHGGFLS